MGCTQNKIARSSNAGCRTRFTFFAFKFYLKFYTGGFSNFLDDVCKRGNKNFENNSDTFINIGNELNNAVEFTVSIFGENSFRNFSKDGYETRFNRAVFDIFVYYFSDKYLRKLTKLKMHDVRQEFEKLCISDEKFQESIGLSTKSPKYTFYRIRAWGLKLSKIVEYKIEDIPNQNDK